MFIGNFGASDQPPDILLHYFSNDYCNLILLYGVKKFCFP